jgi:hypothetical protein
MVTLASLVDELTAKPMCPLLCNNARGRFVAGRAAADPTEQTRSGRKMEMKWKGEWERKQGGKK